MPLLSTRGAASVRGFGFGAAVAESYWLAQLTGSGVNYANGVAVGSSGDVYAGGIASGPGAQLSPIQKIDGKGVLQWQRSYSDGSAGTGTNIWSAAVDSSDNSFYAGQIATGQDGCLIKYNSSGTIQWQRQFGVSSSNDVAYGVALDSSGNAYVAGVLNGSGKGFIAKYDTNGNFQWDNGTAGIFASFAGVAVDSSGNSYVVGEGGGTPSGNPVLVIKFNSSGTVQWQRRFYDTTPATGKGIAVDSSQNVYVTGMWRNPSDNINNLFVMKLDSSGTIQWQRGFPPIEGVGNNEGRAVSVDSASNVYVVSYVMGPAPNYYRPYSIVKFNTSGTLQWQREITLTSTNFEPSGVTVSSTGVPHTVGRGNIPLYAKVPADGSGTGTYTIGSNTYTYAASSMTQSSPSFTQSASPVGTGSPGLTTSTPSINSYTTSYTFAKANIV